MRIEMTACHLLLDKNIQTTLIHTKELHSAGLTTLLCAACKSHGQYSCQIAAFAARKSHFAISSIIGNGIYLSSLVASI